MALFELPLGYSLRSLTDTEVCLLPSAMLRDIPIVHWKLLESFQRRRRSKGLCLGPRHVLSAGQAHAGVTVLITAAVLHAPALKHV